MKVLALLLLTSPLAAQQVDTVVTPRTDSSVQTVQIAYTAYRDSSFYTYFTVYDTAYVPRPLAVVPKYTTLLAYHSCSQKDEGGFGYQGSGFSVQSAEATRGSVCRATYPAGFTAGRAPVNLYHSASGQTVYLSFYVRLSSNYVNQATGTKVFFFVTESKGKVVPFIAGTGLRAEVRLQSTAEPIASRNLLPNQGVPAGLKRGQWYFWEVLLTANTGGQANGAVEWWLDGRLVGRHTGIRFSTTTRNWDAVKWSPTWGGTTGVVPATQWMEVDDITLGNP